MSKTVFFVKTALIVFAAVLCFAAEKQPDAPAPDSITSASMSATKKAESGGAAPLRSLTIEELAGYNGADGKAAYVAIDGVIYDVSPIKAWRKGKHKGRHIAGTELGDAIRKKSPHGLKVLKNLKVVGKLVPAAE
ncbi:MAG: hypothetical protein JW913_06985 [Chitinispirillaceae bacterium]|nr:hypothetical protein [Chitinispirillaceae bacterium]